MAFPPRPQRDARTVRSDERADDQRKDALVQVLPAALIQERALIRSVSHGKASMEKDSRQPFTSPDQGVGEGSQDARINACREDREGVMTSKDAQIRDSFRLKRVPPFPLQAAASESWPMVQVDTWRLARSSEDSFLCSFRRQNQPALVADNFNQRHSR